MHINVHLKLTLILDANYFNLKLNKTAFLIQLLFSPESKKVHGHVYCQHQQIRTETSCLEEVPKVTGEV